MARLDASQIRQALDLAESRLAAERGSTVENEAQLREARTRERRIRQLVREGLSTDADKDAVEAEVEVLEARLAAQGHRVRAAEHEVRIAKQSPSGAWRFGMGLQFGSMDPAEDPNIPPETEELWLPDEEWARLETSLHVTRVFNPRGTFRPYLQGRVGIERIHPRSELFYNKPDEGLEPGESPIFQRWLGALGQPGPLLHAMFYLNTLPE